MGRAAVVLVCLARGASADPPLSAQVGGAGGIGYASLSGAYRDDDFATLRLGVGIGTHVAADVGFGEDLDRIEPSFGLGARVRPWSGECWRARWSPYFRGELALAGAAHFGSNYDLTLGVGHWGELRRWLGWYAELDAIARVGEVQTWSAHVELGLSFATSSFWR